MFAIKVKHEDDKRWSFLTPNGGTTYLRVHASVTPDKERAEGFVKTILEDNPDFAAKVVVF
jgi:hypothetical protein